MKSLKYLFLLVVVTSCGLVGIHLKVKNPKPGEFLDLGEEMRVLGANNALRTEYDVTFYRLDISINAKDKSLGGWVEMRCKALANIDSLQLDLDDILAIDGIHYGSRETTPLQFTRHYRAVKIKLPSSIKKGESFVIHTQYHGNPQIAKRPPWAGGTVWKKDKKGNAWLGVACETEGSSVWFPCKDMTSDEPDSAVIGLTIPDNGLTAVSNGELENVFAVDGLKTFIWRVHYAINPYNITYYVGNFVPINDQYIGVDGDTLAITHYVLKPDEEEARDHLVKVKDNIRVYEEIWGPYQFYKDGFKLVASPYAGMEHQSAIAYGNKYKLDLYGMEDYTMLHETGHEWFGNAVSAADLADVWLQEGVTTYGESVYLERQYGKAMGYRHLLLYRMMIKNKLPLVAPFEQRYFDYHDGDVYVKGAWVLHTLRFQLEDDSLFFKIMRTFYKEQSLKSTSSKDFIATVNRITGKDWQWFFNQYLYKNSVPVFEYCIRDNAIFYRWTDCDSSFNKLKINVGIEGINELYPFIPTTKVKKITLPAGAGTEVKPQNAFALFAIRKNKKLKE